MIIEPLLQASVVQLFVHSPSIQLPGNRRHVALNAVT